MKKVYISFLIVMALVISNVVVCYGDTKSVKGTFIKKEGDSTVYSVDITWGALTFNYKGYVKLDTSGKFYQAAGTTSTWAGAGNTITVNNKSEAKVVAKYTYNVNSSMVTGAKATCSPTSAEIDTKANGSNAKTSSTCTVTMSGVPTKIATTELKNVDIGTVKVTLTN